jgi:DNA-binding transcriptional LysR family regulator
LRYFVMVAEERHIGRAAARLQMTQPPLSRALRRLESDLGTALLERTRTGVELTEAGRTLLEEARAVLDRAERLQARVRASAGHATLALGTLADTVELVGGRLVAEFRRHHPHVGVTVHESDLGDPSAGLRAGLVDIALTRLPFDDTGLRSQVLQAEPIGLVVRDDDPLAGGPPVRLAELSGRPWIRLPAGTDPVWTAYWTGAADPAVADLTATDLTATDLTATGPSNDLADADRTGRAGLATMHTIQECLQSVLWNGAAALAPLDQVLPAGLVTVPVADRAPSRLALVWPADGASPLVRSFARVAADTYRRR